MSYKKTEYLKRPGEYEPGTVFAAQDLYCVDRLTFEATAARTGVSVAALKRWAEKFDWRAKREELAQAESRIRHDTYKARQKMLTKVIEDGGALDAFAVAKLETLALEQVKFLSARRETSPLPIPDVTDKNKLDDLVEKALSRKLAALLAAPETLDLKALRDLREALKLAAEMKGRADETPAAGLSPDIEAKIKKILAEGL